MKCTIKRDLVANVLFFCLVPSLHTCATRNIQSNTNDQNAQTLGEVQAPKNRISPEDIIILFPIVPTKLDKAQSTPEVIKEISQFLEPQNSWWSTSTYKNLIDNVTQVLNESNPISDSISEEIKKIPLERWFTVGLRFEICGFTQFVPGDWLADLPQDQQTALCEVTIRTVQQPFGFRIERGADGNERNAWSSDDKALHLVLDYTDGISDQELTILKETRKIFKVELEKQITLGTLSKEQFKKLVEPLFSQQVCEIVLKLQKSMKKLVLQLRGEFNGGPVKASRNPTMEILSYRNFISKSLTRVAELKFVTHAFSTTGLRPSSDNQWVFGVSEPQDATKLTDTMAWKLKPIKFMHENSGQVVGIISPGLIENFSDQPGEISSADPDLIEFLEKNEPARNAMLRTSALRVTMKFENGKLTGESELSPESLPGEEFKKTLETNFDHVLDAKIEHLHTQSCVSCHIQDGFTEKVGLTPREAQKIKGNRPPDKNLITEQSSLKPTWNLRQLGYFGRGPTVGSRLIKENDLQVKIFNELP